MHTNQLYKEKYYTSQDGLKLYYRHYDNGDKSLPTLLMMSGIARTSADFEILALKYKDRFNIICPDYRGRGNSEWAKDWKTYNPVQYAQDIQHLLVASQTKKIALIGTSLGGVVSLILSVLIPHQISGIILNDIGAEIEFKDMGKLVAYIEKNPIFSSWEETEAYAKETYAFMRMDRDPRVWEQFLKGTYRENKDGNIRTSWDPKIAMPIKKVNGSIGDLWIPYKAIHKIPTLLLRGEFSNLLSPETVAKMKKLKPNLEAITIPGAGHPPSLNEPESLIAIENFLITR